MTSRGFQRVNEDQRRHLMSPLITQFSDLKGSMGSRGMLRAPEGPWGPMGTRGIPRESLGAIGLV